MKKQLSIILCIVLAVSMLFTMTGCGSEQDELIGRWEGEIDFSDYFNSMFPEVLGEEIASYLDFKDVSVIMIMEFDEDGIMTTSADEDSEINEDKYYEYELSGDKLKITYMSNVEDNDLEFDEALFPWVFEKQ